MIAYENLANTLFFSDFFTVAQMKNPLYAVYGASGYGREVMPLLRAQLQAQKIDSSRLIFIDDNPETDAINGHSIFKFDDFMQIEASERFVTLAIANSIIREKLEKRCQENNIQFLDVAASNVCVMDNVNIGEGSILSPFSSLTSNVQIGRQFHANIYSYVAHDCIIGDYVTFAPGVKLNGNIIVEDHAYIGTGAVIKQGKPGEPIVIGHGAVIGMGAVVTKSIPPGVTVIGNPAKPLIRLT